MHDPNFAEQLIVVLTAIFASVGAAGIPNAGLVTQYIALLITVDCFFYRCRTAIGNMTVSALVDGKQRHFGEAKFKKL